LRQSTLPHNPGPARHADGGSFEFFARRSPGGLRTELTALRCERIGFVFQSFNLIDDLTVAETSKWRCSTAGPSGERRRRVAEALKRSALGHRAKHRPQQLSAVSSSRVAVPAP